MNFAELFNIANSDISDIDDNNETATNNYDQNKDNDVDINYINDIEQNNKFSTEPVFALHHRVKQIPPTNV